MPYHLEKAELETNTTTYLKSKKKMKNEDDLY